MWRKPFLATFLALLALPVAGEASMDCSIGRLEKVFGGNPWVVHGCADGKSVVVVADQGNPAQPFFFLLFPEGSQYRLYGEGTGDRAHTKPAYDELAAALSEAFVSALHAEAVASAKDPGAKNGT
jgi:hypothetical protein